MIDWIEMGDADWTARQTIILESIDVMDSDKKSDLEKDDALLRARKALGELPDRIADEFFSRVDWGAHWRDTIEAACRAPWAGCCDGECAVCVGDFE